MTQHPSNRARRPVVAKGVKWTPTLASGRGDRGCQRRRRSNTRNADASNMVSGEVGETTNGMPANGPDWDLHRLLGVCQVWHGSRRTAIRGGALPAHHPPQAGLGRRPSAICTQVGTSKLTSRRLSLLTIAPLQWELSTWSVNCVTMSRATAR